MNGKWLYQLSFDLYLEKVDFFYIKNKDLTNLFVVVVHEQKILKKLIENLSYMCVLSMQYTFRWTWMYVI